MGHRATASGLRLNEREAALVKAMLLRGDRQHDIAAWFGVNGGRIGEIASGKAFAQVNADINSNLPPPGPYPSGRDAVVALDALMAARAVIDAATKLLQRSIV